MSKAAIVVDGVSKSYLLGHRRAYTTLRDVIARDVRNFSRKATDLIRGRQIIQGDEIEEFWALKNVTFEVKEGDVVGIIGRNGAGKSTLLKILSRVTEPTAGRVLLSSRAASLLEVGTGFHPELTGRENVFLNGAILGMTKREIQKKFDEIVAFAGVERFLETPVKRYSSGMYVRLAFAVAAHLEPKILIVDEVLAVGDADFQKKCLGKMNEVSRLQGRTVLLVTHNMGIVASLCPTAIWLENGQIREHGSARSLVTQYLAQSMPNQDPLIRLGHLGRSLNSDDDRLRLESIEWLSGLPLQHGEPLNARITFATRRSISDLTIGIGFSSRDGRRLLTYDTDFQDGHRPSLETPGTYAVEIEIDSLPLVPDLYEIDIGSRSGDNHALDYIAGGFQLEVVSGPSTPGFIVQNEAGVYLASKCLWHQAFSETVEWQSVTPSASLIPL